MDVMSEELGLGIHSPDKRHEKLYLRTHVSILVEIPGAYTCHNQSTNKGWLHLDGRQVITKMTITFLKAQVGKVLERVAQLCNLCDPSPLDKGLNVHSSGGLQDGGFQSQGFSGFLLIVWHVGLQALLGQQLPPGL